MPDTEPGTETKTQIIQGFLFSETDYLAMNPDVRSAIDKGIVPSAQWHFEHFGIAEGRAGHRPSQQDSQRLAPSVHFFSAKPNYQHAFDLFKNEWSTRLPDSCGWVASTGPARHCEDPRVIWVAEKLGGFRNKSVLELGPLEGGHAVMLERMGAREIRAIEANSRAFLKCLVVKEAFGLVKARFELGDFYSFMKESRDHFDTVFACGVLYHLLNPVEVIEQISLHCTEVFVWTHYYDAAFFANNAGGDSPFDAPKRDSYAGYNYTRNHRRYHRALDWNGFCGGGFEAGCWLSKADIEGAFIHFGFEIIDVVEEQNPNGPAMRLAARKRP